ncbi:MAG TPA: LpxD N-terminal domain-containing protein, partial [Gemmatimonadaceae bacterium]|nr:LpxD N-terminal domain-containing protein [Gemmatimonadaceae bacterium]
MTAAATPAMTAAEVAAAVGGTLTGSHDTTVDGIAPLDRATARDLSFLATAKYAGLFERSGAGVVLVSAELALVPGK